LVPVTTTLLPPAVDADEGTTASKATGGKNSKGKNESLKVWLLFETRRRTRSGKGTAGEVHSSSLEDNHFAGTIAANMEV
jgi:hypothetical protein